MLLCGSLNGLMWHFNYSAYITTLLCSLIDKHSVNVGNTPSDATLWRKTLWFIWQICINETIHICNFHLWSSHLQLFLILDPSANPIFHPPLPLNLIGSKVRRSFMSTDNLVFRVGEERPILEIWLFDCLIAIWNTSVMVIGSVLYCQYIVLVLPKRYHTCYPSVVDGTGVSYIGSVVSYMANTGILLPKPSFTLDAITCILLLVARLCLNFEVTKRG